MNARFYQFKRSLKQGSFGLGLLLFLLAPDVAYAQTALTWARVEQLRNRVQLIPQGRTARLARLADVMGLGDALRTDAASRAELRFNDGSLARIGERAVFRFTPNTRNFQLSNGTMLLLVPPGQGRTTIQTPNAVTGIQGSALFVRNIPETNTTIIGALTNNLAGPMIAYNQDGSQQQEIYAGQLVVIEGNQITELYEFDLQEFCTTSSLMTDLNLCVPITQPGTDNLDGVRQEILDALAQQEALAGEGVLENPSFMVPAVVSSTSAPEVPDYEGSPAAQFQQLAPQVATGNGNAISTRATDAASAPVSPTDAIASEQRSLRVNDDGDQDTATDTAVEPTQNVPTMNAFTPSTTRGEGTVSTGGSQSTSNPAINPITQNPQITTSSPTTNSTGSNLPSTTGNSTPGVPGLGSTPNAGSNTGPVTGSVSSPGLSSGPSIPNTASNPGSSNTVPNNPTVPVVASTPPVTGADAVGSPLPSEQPSTVPGGNGSTVTPEVPAPGNSDRPDVSPEDFNFQPGTALTLPNSSSTPPSPTPTEEIPTVPEVLDNSVLGSVSILDPAIAP